MRLPPKIRATLTNEFNKYTYEELSESEESYYQLLIGVLRCIVGLVRADICVNVSTISLKMSLPRFVRLQEVLHIFAYLKAHINSELVFDQNEIFFDKYMFPGQDWTYNIYHGEESELREVIPPDMAKLYEK